MHTDDVAQSDHTLREWPPESMATTGDAQLDRYSVRRPAAGQHPAQVEPGLAASLPRYPIPSSESAFHIKTSQLPHDSSRGRHAVRRKIALVRHVQPAFKPSHISVIDRRPRPRRAHAAPTPRRAHAAPGVRRDAMRKRVEIFGCGATGDPWRIGGFLLF